MEKTIREHYHIAVANNSDYQEVVVKPLSSRWEVKDWTGIFGAEDVTIAISGSKEEAVEMALSRLLALFPSYKPVYGAGSIDTTFLSNIFKKVRFNQKTKKRK